jgi:uracil-DNA glycosylase family 4
MDRGHRAAMAADWHLAPPIRVSELFPSLDRSLLKAAAALTDLEADCAACHRCPLAHGRQQVVISSGNPAARLMLIGEGPGAEEDACGLPFVGRSGRLLDALLAGAGIDRERDVYVCNVVKCRPPQNRRPSAAEMAACRPWLDRQIAAVDPALILLAGASALQAVLGIRGSDSRFVFIWDQDVVDIICRGLRTGRAGIFNLAGDGALTLKEIAELLDKPYRPLPAGLVRTALRVLKPLGLSPYGPEQVDFLRYRPVLSNRRLKHDFGFSPRYSSREAFLAFLRAQGVSTRY